MIEEEAKPESQTAKGTNGQQHTPPKSAITGLSAYKMGGGMQVMFT